MVQLLAASACRGQFSSSMPESYSSSEESLAGALKFKWKTWVKFRSALGLCVLGFRKRISNTTHMCVTDLMYLGCDFPWTTSLFSSTAMMSECGTSNMGSRRSFSCVRKEDFTLRQQHKRMKTDINSLTHLVKIPRTMMDRSPRAPVFLSKAILAMALKAS